MFTTRSRRQSHLMPGLRWVENPGRIDGCPEGLECLDAVDALTVRQVHEWAQIITGFETKNKYVVLGEENEQMFYMEEQSNWLERLCCTNNRRFWMDVMNESGRMVARFYKTFPCSCNRYCNCSNASMHIYAPPENKIGVVKEVTGCCRPTFHVINQSQEVVYKIRAPRCKFGTVNFKISDIETEEHVGTIGKQWGGLMQEYFTTTDTFGILFPDDIEPIMKVILMGATIFIDLRFFEDSDVSVIDPI